MITAQEKDQLIDLLGEMFEDLAIEDVADVLTTRLAMTIAQGSSNHKDALAFLRQASSDIADYLRYADFEANGTDDAFEEPATPSRN